LLAEELKRMDSIGEIDQLRQLEISWQGSPSTNNQLTFSSTVRKTNEKLNDVGE
jgi:hypothetical protein